MSSVRFFLKTMSRDLFLVAVFVSADLIFRKILSGHMIVACNEQGSWGLPVDSRILAVLALPVLAAVPIIGFRSGSRIVRFSSVLVISGGIANLYDRVVFGCVRDFPVFPFFPAFNMGDVLLSVGGFLACAMIFRRQATQKACGIVKRNG
jgi:lipoprotein signal peptidase